MSRPLSDELRETLQRLGGAMRDLQEECYCAQWMCVTPTIEGLCRAAIKTGKPQPWGGGELSVSAARQMWEMAERLRGWPEPDWDGDAGRYLIAHPFCPLESDGLEEFYGRQSSDL